MRYASSSSVSNPCEGAHTDSEDDHRQDGSVTPIMEAQLTNRLPTAPVFNAGSLFSSKQAKVDALEAKAQKKDKQKKHKKKERKQRVSKPKIREIKERELRSIKNTPLVTDPVLRHLTTQTKVLLQKNLLRKRIQVLSRYFNFEIIGFCVDL